MNLLTDTLRCVQFIYSVPFKAAHWASLKVANNVKEWHPLNLLTRSSKYGIIILNQPLAFKEDQVVTLWNRAAIRATVDGGTNEWYKFSLTMENQLNNPIPDLVSGDFDSVEPQSLSYFRCHGSKIVHTPDQNETDFTKSIRLVNEEVCTRDIKVDAIVAVCENSGRLDHIMANLNTLTRAPTILAVPLYQLTANSLTWVLSAGRHKIHVNERCVGQWCGLIPLGQPAFVSTSGLKWNLACEKLEFGGLVSTSNMFDDNAFVTVETDRPILFTMALSV